MVHKIADLDVQAVSDFKESQTKNKKTLPVLGQDYPYIRAIGKLPTKISFTATAFGADASFLKNNLKHLAALGSPIFMDSNVYKGWLDPDSISVDTLSLTDYDIPITADAMGIGLYKGIITSIKNLISNNIITEATMIPTCMVPTGAKVIDEGFVKKTEGKIDIYQTNKLELVEGIQITPIKIYDTVNDENPDNWKLIYNPEKHAFIGDWAIEAGNIRLTSAATDNLWVWIGSAWVLYSGDWFVMDTYSSVNKYSNKSNQKGGYLTLSGNVVQLPLEMGDINYPTSGISASYDRIYLKLDRAFSFSKSKMDTVGATLFRINPVNTNVIYINSSGIILVGGKPDPTSEYGYNTGADGFAISIDLTSGIVAAYFTVYEGQPIIKSDGYPIGAIYEIPLVKYSDILFNDASDGLITRGTVVADSDAHGNTSIQGTADPTSGLLVEVFSNNTNITPENWALLDGDYLVSVRIKASAAAATDIITLEVLEDGISLVSVNKTAAEITTNYTSVSLPFSYDSSKTYDIRIIGNTNTADTLFNLDCGAIIPHGDLEELQKEVLVNNNQKLSVIPRS